MGMERPVWIAFDLNGTLLDPAALLGAGREEMGQAALDDAVMQAMADTLTGEHRPFPDYLRASLERRLHAEQMDGELLAVAMQRAATLPPFGDASPALQTLSDAGFRVAVVTNSAGKAAGEALRAAALDERVELVVGADEVGAYKPDARVYRHAAGRLDAPADAICLVAAHAWDVLGAMRAGWNAAWVAHRERHLLATVPQPAVTAASLLDAARQLAAL
jgi:2-haloacid dehalogenase